MGSFPKTFYKPLELMLEEHRHDQTGNVRQRSSKCSHVTNVRRMLWEHSINQVMQRLNDVKQTTGQANKPSQKIPVIKKIIIVTRTLLPRNPNKTAAE